MLTDSVGRQVLDCTPLRALLARNHTLQRLLSALLMIAGLFLASSAQAQNLCYAVADDGNRLVSMNSDGSNFTDIGGTGVSNIEGIAMEPGLPNTLFAADAGQFGEINLSTGTFTAIGSGIGTGTGTDGSIDLDDLDSLAFDIYTGILWGVHRRGSAEDVLIQIDHTTGSFIPNVFSGSACGATSPCDYVVVESNSGFTNVSSQTRSDPEY